MGQQWGKRTAFQCKVLNLWIALIPQIYQTRNMGHFSKSTGLDLQFCRPSSLLNKLCKKKKKSYYRDLKGKRLARGAFNWDTALHWLRQHQSPAHYSWNPQRSSHSWGGGADAQTMLAFSSQKSNHTPKILPCLRSAKIYLLQFTRIVIKHFTPTRCCKKSSFLDKKTRRKT